MEGELKSKRYPDNFYLPELEEAKDALNDAAGKRVKEFVLSLLKDELLHE